MKKTILLFLIGISSLLSACGSGSGSNNNGAPATGGPNQPKVEPKSKTAKEYFDQFQLKLTGTCENKEELKINFLESNRFLIKTNEAGRKIVGKIEVYLINEEKFIINYRQEELLKVDAATYDAKLIKEEQAYLDYSIENDLLILNTLGVGKVVTHNGKDAVGFTLSKEAEDIGGRTIILQYVERATTSVPGIKNADEICENHERK